MFSKFYLIKLHNLNYNIYFCNSLTICYLLSYIPAETCQPFINRVRQTARTITGRRFVIVVFTALRLLVSTLNIHFKLWKQE